MDENEREEHAGFPSEPLTEESVTDPSDAGTEETRGFDITKELYDWAQALVFSISLIVVLFTFFFRIIGVDGASMEPTLYNNDKVVVTNMFYTPKQGDVIVLLKKSFLDEPLVKRVIATEGQTVDIDFIAHEVRVDGVLLDEPYVKAPISRPGDIEFPVTVPEGCVFVLGDNRNNSADSRLSKIGMVDERCILGRVIYRIYPFDSIGGIK